MKLALILLAGGQSKRMGPDFSKVFYRYKDKPIALYSLEPFLYWGRLSQIVVVCPQGSQVHFPASITFAPPGPERFLSLESGLLHLSPHITHVLVHDAARPLILLSDIEKLVEEGLRHEGGALGSKVKNSLTRATQHHTALEIVDREGLWETHTPQFGKVDDLKTGIAQAKKAGEIPQDEISLLKQIGLHPKLIESSFPNIKITLPSDLPLVCHLLDQLHAEFFA